MSGQRLKTLMWIRSSCSASSQPPTRVTSAPATALRQVPIPSSLVTPTATMTSGHHLRIGPDSMIPRLSSVQRIPNAIIARPTRSRPVSPGLYWPPRIRVWRRSSMHHPAGYLADHDSESNRLVGLKPKQEQGEHGVLEHQPQRAGAQDQEPGSLGQGASRAVTHGVPPSGSPAPA